MPHHSKRVEGNRWYRRKESNSSNDKCRLSNRSPSRPIGHNLSLYRLPLYRLFDTFALITDYQSM